MTATTACPRPEKGAYPSKLEAEHAILSVWRKLGGGPKLRAYQCDCGMWHLTKRQDTAQWRPSLEFERLVDEDLRDKFGSGHAYAVLSRRENLVRWLQVLTDIRRSILSRNAHDNAVLRAHPDRPDGGRTPRSYLEAKKAIDERKRARERLMEAVNERVGEVRRLIGATPLSRRTAGMVSQWLVDIDSTLRDGDVDDAREKLTVLMAIVTSAGEEQP